MTAVASFIQVYQIKIPFTNYVLGEGGGGLSLNFSYMTANQICKCNKVLATFSGSGLLSVMGVSFAYIPVGKISLLMIQIFCQNAT